jgi:hypothetical protein
MKSRNIKWAGRVARLAEKRNAYMILVRTPEVKRPLGIPRRRCEDNIKMDFREIGFGSNVKFICLGIRTGGWLL